MCIIQISQAFQLVVKLKLIFKFLLLLATIFHTFWLCRTSFSPEDLRSPQKIIFSHILCELTYYSRLPQVLRNEYKLPESVTDPTLKTQLRGRLLCLLLVATSQLRCTWSEGYQGNLNQFNECGCIVFLGTGKLCDFS